MRRRRYRRYPIDGLRHSHDTDTRYGRWQWRMRKPGERRFLMLPTQKIPDARFTVASVRLDAHRAAVERLQAALTSARDSRKDTVRSCGPGPRDEAGAAGRVKAGALPDVGPGRADPQSSGEAVQDPSLIHPRNTRRPLGHVARRSVTQISLSHGARYQGLSAMT